MPGGKLTPHEQKQEWTRLLSDELVPKDNGGPRGARRCLVVIGNYIVDYDDALMSDGSSDTEVIVTNHQWALVLRLRYIVNTRLMEDVFHGWYFLARW